MIPKQQLIYRLFLLENTRKAFEQDIQIFVNKAFEEVQGFFSSSFPTSVLTDLDKSLDLKCQALDKVSALFKELTVESHLGVKQELGHDKVQPLRMKGIQTTTDVVKFGQVLQNSLVASSTAKAAQVVGATRRFQQLKHLCIPLPSTIQGNKIDSMVSSDSSTFVAKNTSSHMRTSEKEHAVISKEEIASVNVISSPASVESPKIGTKKIPLQPSRRDVVPKISNPRPMEITPLINWGYVSNVQVPHQKQTSAQLLHFLATLNVIPMDWNIIGYLGSPQSVLPSVKTPSCQFGGAATGTTNSDDLKTLSIGIENQAPIFKVKRVETSGSLTYACVIVTKTELWDIGDIFTEVEAGGSQAKPLENNDDPQVPVQENCVAVSQALQSTLPECEGHSSTKMPVFTDILIPEFQIKGFEETEVVVSHVVNPGNFYIQQADSNVKLQSLVTDSLKASCSYAKQNCIPDIGTKVMGWFHKQKQWCRAQVTKICGVGEDGAGSETSVTVEVRRLDHGDTACLSLWNIKELTPEMAVLPLQAVQVSLANVMPVNGNNWSEEAACWFQAVVHNRVLYARLYPEGTKVTVELFLEKGKLGAMRRGASLSLRLAQNGHAKHSKLRKDYLKKCASQVKVTKPDSEWEKHLISYIQSRK